MDLGHENRVLFVCTGNTCRSPMAEWIIRHLAQQRDIVDLEVDSAGMHPSGSLSLNARKEIMKRCGTDPGNRPAKNVRELDMDQFSIILTMTRRQKEGLLRIMEDSSVKRKVQTLYEAIGEDGDVRDPYRQDETVYHRCADEIEGLVLRLLDQMYPSQSY